MSGKRVLITGASKGIGRAVADRVAASGNVPVGLARTGPADFPGEFFEVDLADRVATAEVLERVLACGTIDAVVNNAGVAAGGAFEDIPEAELRRVMDTNLFGAMALTRAAVRRRHVQRLYAFGRCWRR